MKYSAALLIALTAAASAQEKKPIDLLDSILGGMKSFDTAVLQYGGGDISHVLKSAKELTIMLQGATQAIANAPIFTKTDATAMEPDSDAIKEAGQNLFRDIQTTKWAFQIGSVCDKVYAAIFELGELYQHFIIVSHE